jgi:hypothetical protein
MFALARCPLFRACLAAGMLLTVPAGAQTGERFEFVVMGDMPYELPADFARFDRVLRASESSGPAFLVHVGDIKSGQTVCSDAHFETVFGMFEAVAAPVIYTPGDNEWTDCHRPSNGGMDPLERLAKLRQIFFRDSNSLGRTRLPLLRQSADPSLARYVENARWSMRGVVFASIHVVGSNNNRLRGGAEYSERNAANLAWIRAAFAEAERTAARGLVLFAHANPAFGRADSDPRSGFQDFLRLLAEATEAFGKPVVLVHGDTHTYRVDRPLKSPTTRETLLNFLRVEVFGAPSLHAVRISVDPANPSLFSALPLTVPANDAP